MAGRYSDRFFGPAGPGGEPRTPPEGAVYLVEAADIDTASTGAPPDHRDALEAPRPWHTHAAAQVALVFAVLAGAGGGAYGWDRWRDHQAEIVARSVVDLSSSASVNSFNEDGTEFEIGVTLRNGGDHGFTVLGIGATDARLVPAGAKWRRVELGPGDDLHRAVSFTIDCSGGGDLLNIATPALTADLTSVDGASHLETVDVDYYGGSLRQLLDQQCAISDGDADYGGLYPEVVRAEVIDDSVAATIVLHRSFSGPDPVPQTYNAVSSSSGFSTVLDHSGEDPGGSAAVRVVWTVRDCALALAATDFDMTIELTGQMPSEPTASTLTALPSTALTVALARLSERVCD